MKIKNALKTIIISLFFPVLYTVLLLLVNMGYQRFYGIIHSIERQADYESFMENASEAVAANSMFILLVAIVIFFAIVFVIFKVKGKSLLKRIQWNTVHKSIYVLVVLAAFTNIVTINLTYALMPQSLLEGAENYSDSVISGAILLTLALVVLLAPIVEETIFRGLMLTRLQKNVPVWLSVALSALAFSAVHFSGGIGQLIGTGWIGVFFCLIFLWTKSIRASMLAHIINNLLAWLLPVTVITNMSLPIKLILIVIGFAVTVFALCMIYNRWDKEIVTVFE